ncbi:hypothetical protein [Methylobacterium radiotolerans]|nr:hypothetical protein [Methylobacterium radiotolerans]UIY45670.1 hypothetical protein LZ599_31430 [Methylobacterium radiotolerans]
MLGLPLWRRRYRRCLKQPYLIDDQGGGEFSQRSILDLNDAVVLGHLRRH